MVFAPFHCIQNKLKHSCKKGAPLLSDNVSQFPINITRWRESSSTYKIDYYLHFEPYVIVSYDSPRYSEIFNIGNDKTSHIYEIFANKYEFHVIPKLFISHIPHDNVGTAVQSNKFSYFIANINWILFDIRIRDKLKFYYYCDWVFKWEEAPGKTCYSEENIYKMILKLDKIKFK
jgi:hypothetical protein